MTDTTPNLGLPLIAAAQAQKHVTHNEALLALDALAQCVVLDKDLAAPPATPAYGDRYIVAAGPTGAWAGHAAAIAIWQEGYGWAFRQARAGFLAYVLDEALLYVFDGTSWVTLASATGLQNLGRLGVGTTADSTNPFSAKLNKALWTAKTAAEGGDGDLRYSMNKETVSDVVSLLFQTGYSGRLELGLVGSDDLSAKVSTDGATWRQALTLAGATGGIDFLSASTDVASAATTDLGAAPTRKVNLTGTAAITSFGTGAHKERLLLFAGALTLTHNAASLVLPTGANIVTAAGDTAYATSDSSGNWRLRHYQRADGGALAASPAAFQSGVVNATFAVSVTSNALTVALKTASGNDPSAADPVRLLTRSTTLANGTYDTLAITSALALTIPSGATLGIANGVASRIWLLLFNDGGTPRLGAMNTWDGSGIARLDPTALASSVAIGSGATAAGTFYTAAAVASKAFRILGSVEYSAGLATAGAYASAPDRAHLFGPGVRLPGQEVQSVRTTSSTQTDTTSTAGVATAQSATLSGASPCNVVEVESIGALYEQAGYVALLKITKGGTAMASTSESSAYAASSAVQVPYTAKAREVLNAASATFGSTIRTTGGTQASHIAGSSLTVREIAR